MDLHEIFIKGTSWPRLEAIRIHCHLEVTVAQQGHFGIKLTVAQKR